MNLQGHLKHGLKKHIFILLVKNIHCQKLWAQGRKNYLILLNNISKDTFHILHNFIFVVVVSFQAGSYVAEASLNLDT